MPHDDLTLDIWYFAGLSRDLPKGKMQRKIIAGQPINIGRDEEGALFALRDICPHRAAPLSKGCLKAQSVACPYHGWRFNIHSGVCLEIPALTAQQNFKADNIKSGNIKTGNIRLATYPIDEKGQLVWIYIASNPQKSPGHKALNNKALDNKTLQRCTPPEFPMAQNRAVIDDRVVLNCHIDHAVIGLMDPAHGPYVHHQWWWRSQKSMHDKAKAFIPSPAGFTMRAHKPSSNSLAYKLLGGQPVTEIQFQLPGIRSETITIGPKTVLSLTALTPIDDNHTEIRQLFFSDHRVFKTLSPIIKYFAAKFLRQDSDMVALQQTGLQFGPKLMLIDDADTQAKWYFSLKKEWAQSRAQNRDFINPVKAKTLYWRS